MAAGLGTVQQMSLHLTKGTPSKGNDFGIFGMLERDLQRE
jgi:hypothetical protein